jgi:hypothetical protein
MPIPQIMGRAITQVPATLDRGINQQIIINPINDCGSEDARNKHIVGIVGVFILSISYEGAEVLFNYTPGSESKEEWSIDRLCSICTDVNIVFFIGFVIAGKRYPS